MGNSFYDVAAKIIQKLSDQRGTIKSLVMAEKTTDKKLLYAIICETLKYRQVIEEIMEKSGILKQEKKMGKYLLTVLIYDLLFGKGRISGVYKEKILRHKTRLNAELVKIKIKRGCKDNKDLIPEHIRNAIVLPRYVRVNTIKISVPEAIKHFEKKGYQMADSSILDADTWP